MNKYELEHHGIQGQRWGIRRYQNPDGSLTSAGRKRLKKYVDPRGNLTDKGRRAFESYRIAKSYEKLAEDAYRKTSNESEKFFQKTDGGKYEKRVGGMSRDARQLEYITNEKYKKLVDSENEALDLLKKAQRMSQDKKQEISKKGRIFVDIAIDRVGLYNQLPNAGMVYTTGTNPQSIKANLRSKNWKTNNK